ncbi:MAG: hypothetical protein QGG14_08465 [Planctomycetota bacterium]|nr:hypothetical protein [Planctomycetota bacterium]
MLRPTLWLVGFFCLGLVGESLAQSVLTVEKRQDRRERDRLHAHFRKLRVNVGLNDEGPAALARELNLFVRGLTMFVVKPHEGGRDWASMKLELKRVPLYGCLSIVQRTHPIRFVFKLGVVMIMHPDDVREETYLRVYDVRAATFRIRDFPGPRLDLPISERAEEVEPEGTEKTASGVTLEKLEELIRSGVLPASWGGDNGASISAGAGLLIIRQTEKGHVKVGELLWRLGIGPRPRHLFKRPRRRSAARKPPSSGSDRVERRRAAPAGAKRSTPPRSKRDRPRDSR